MGNASARNTAHPRPRGCLVLAALLLAACPPLQAKDILVRDQAAYHEAVPTLAPGDTLLLADGEWRDFQVLFTGKGTAERPITLTAQTAATSTGATCSTARAVRWCCVMATATWSRATCSWATASRIPAACA